jgi:hypothetical protein
MLGAFVCFYAEARFFLEHSIQDAIHECPRLLIAESFDDLDGLIQGDPGGNLGQAQEFVDCHAEHVSINAGHSRNGPVLTIPGDERIKLGDASDDAVDEGLGETSAFRAYGVLIPKLFKPSTGATMNIPLKEYLQGKFPRFVTQIHGRLP